MLLDRILKMVEVGLIDEWKQKYSEGQKYCKIIHQDDVIENLAQPIYLDEFLDPLFLYMLGMLIAVACFIFENCFRCKKT